MQPRFPNRKTANILYVLPARILLVLGVCFCVFQLRASVLSESLQRKKLKVNAAKAKILPYHATYKLQAADLKKTSKNQKKSALLDGMLYVSLKKEKKSWIYKEKGSLSFLNASGRLIFCKTSYSFKESEDGNHCFFDFFLHEGEEVIRRKGRVFVDRLLQKTTIFWEQPVKNVVIISGEVMGPTRLMQLVLNSAVRSPFGVIKGYCFDGRQDQLFWMNAVHGQPIFLKNKSGFSQAWSLSQAFYDGKKTPQSLRPIFSKDLMFGSDGVPLRMEKTIGQNALQCFLIQKSVSQGLFRKHKR